MKRPFSPLITSAGPLKLSATDFKSRCIAMMQAVHDGTTDEIVVTKRGKPLVKIVSCRVRDQTLFGFAAGKLALKADVFETGETWDAQER